MSALVVPKIKYGYTFHWKIENLFRSFLKKGERLDSPLFTAENTKWSLRLYPMGYKDENYVGFFMYRDADCSGPHEIEAFFEIVFRREDNSILAERHLSTYSYRKNRAWGISNCFVRERFCCIETKMFSLKDTQLIECTMNQIDESLSKQKHLYARTVFIEKQSSFTWKTDKFSILKHGVSKIFKEDMIDFHFFVNSKEIVININAIDESIKCFSVMPFITEPERGTKYATTVEFLGENLKIGKETPSLYYLPLRLIQSQSIDEMSFDFQCTIPIKTAFYESQEIYTSPSKPTENAVEIRKNETLNPSMLVEDLKLLFHDEILSDIELRVSSKTFKAHKNILSARSPVFRSMFSINMKEKNTGHVNITDFEEDTVRRMLLYIYTDSLETLEFESASDLYRIADKYEIMSLKSRCTSILKENLCPENACDVLVLADLYRDDDLKTNVQDYVLQQDKVFFASEKWTNFMDNHLKLAADVMYKNINK